VSRTVQANAPAAPASGGRTLRGVPDVIDTATLSLEGEVVRLFGVEWAPGGGKPEDLTRYLQGRETVCEPAGGNDTYRCMVGGQDLSRVVLFNGGGKPTAEATPELKAAADKARETKIGVWNQQP
jgi:endonuclease YncB( thermonuclease family)